MDGLGNGTSKTSKSGPRTRRARAPRSAALPSPSSRPQVVAPQENGTTTGRGDVRWHSGSGIRPEPRSRTPHHRAERDSRANMSRPAEIAAHSFASIRIPSAATRPDQLTDQRDSPAQSSASLQPAPNAKPPIAPILAVGRGPDRPPTEPRSCCIARIPPLGWQSDPNPAARCAEIPGDSFLRAGAQRCPR